MVHIHPRKHVLDHPERPTLTGQHDLDSADHISTRDLSAVKYTDHEMGPTFFFPILFTP